MAAFLVAANVLKVLPFKLPPVGPHDVRLRMKAVGICATDVHYLKEMEVAGKVVKEPIVIGHECAGVVEEVGSEVKNVAVGDRVAIEPGASCWKCDLCRNGRYNLCPDVKFLATPPYHGGLANQIVHPADLCFKIPDNVSLEEGAMIEPLSVSFHACLRAVAGPDTDVLIVGAGPLGLMTLITARAFGCPKIVMVDVDGERLAFAESLGADKCVKVSVDMKDMAEEVAEIQKAMGGPIDITFECVGFSKSMSTALRATRSGGKVCLLGLGHSQLTVPLTSAAAREVDILGVFRFRNTYPLCAKFMGSGKVDVKPLITHRFGFSQEEIEKAFEISARGGNAIKVMFNL
ncbi:unnamed protein product [Victoria cruziana]